MKRKIWMKINPFLKLALEAAHEELRKNILQWRSSAIIHRARAVESQKRGPRVQFLWQILSHSMKWQRVHKIWKMMIACMKKKLRRIETRRSTNDQFPHICSQWVHVPLLTKIAWNALLRGTGLKKRTLNLRKQWQSMRQRTGRKLLRSLMAGLMCSAYIDGRRFLIPLSSKVHGLQKKIN